MDDLAGSARAGDRGDGRAGPRLAAGEPWPLADVVGPGPESSWGPREVLAHVAEMLPFWLGEIELILDAGGGVGAAGVRAAGGRRRCGSRSSRGIGRSRRASCSAASRPRGGGSRGGSGRSATRMRRRSGRHVTRGDLSVRDIAERLIVGHLEGHVTQLRETVARPADARPREPMFMLWAIPIGILARARRSRGQPRRPRGASASAGRGSPSRGCSSRSCCSPRPATRLPAPAARRSTSRSTARGVRRRRCGTSGSRACRSSRSGRSRISPRSSANGGVDAGRPGGACHGRAAGRRLPHEQRRARRSRRSAAHGHLRDPGGLPFANVFSVGDVLIAVGIVVVIAAAMRRPSRRRQPARVEAQARRPARASTRPPPERRPRAARRARPSGGTPPRPPRTARSGAGPTRARGAPRRWCRRAR